MTELRRSSRVRQSAKHSPTYYEPDEKFSLFATPGVRPRKWKTAEASAGYFTIKRWVPKDQQHLTADLHGGLTDPAEIAAAKLALRANSKASTRFKARSRMSNVVRLSSSRRVSLSDNSYGAGGGSAWGGGSGTSGAGPSPASSPPPPPPPPPTSTSTSSSPPPLPATLPDGTAQGGGRGDDQGRAAPYSGEMLRGGGGGGGGDRGGGGRSSGGATGDRFRGKAVDGAGGVHSADDGDGGNDASDDGAPAGAGSKDSGHGGGGSGSGKRPASAMGHASEDVVEPPLQSRRISPEEQRSRGLSDPSGATTGQDPAQSPSPPPPPPPGPSGEAPGWDERNKSTENSQAAPVGWQAQSQQKQPEMVGCSLGAKQERGIGAGVSGAGAGAVVGIGAGKAGIWGAGVGKEATAVMQQPWGVCER